MSEELYITTTETIYPGDSDFDNVVVRLYGRNRDQEARTVTVQGFDPYFLTDKECFEKVGVADFEGIVGTEQVTLAPLSERFSEDQRDLVKIEVDQPHKIRNLRDEFELTWGADCIFTERFRIDHDIRTGVRVPTDNRRDDHIIVDHEDVEPVEIKDVEPRVLTLDIETDDRGAGFPNPGEARILSVAVHDSYTDEYEVFFDLDGRGFAEVFDLSPVQKAKLAEGEFEISEVGITEPDALHVSQSEKNMLSEFGEYVRRRDFDIIAGWNSGDSSTDGFDLPHIISRMKAVGATASRLSREREVEVKDHGDDFKPSIKGRALYDLMDGWGDTKFTEPRSFKLDDVAEDALGDAKIEHQEMGYFEMYDEDPVKFINYNVKDTRLTVEINAEENVLGFKKRLKDMVGVDWRRTHQNNEFIEMSVRRKCAEHDLAMITAFDNPHVANAGSGINYEGAYVFPAFNGLKRNVCGVDLASLYPMTQWMLNASPDTRVGNMDNLSESNLQERFGGDYVVAANGQIFRTDHDGIIRELVDEYHEVKAEFKAERNAAQYGTDEWEEAAEAYNVTKTIYNSFYGYSGWARSPLYNPHDAAAVTLTGQRVIKATANYISEEAVDGVEVVYGDTDSVPAEEPVLIRNEKGETEFVEVQELEGRNGEVEVWTEDGFTTVKRVWKKPNRKTCYTARTKQGVVHVTEDHSLLDGDGNEVKPEQLSDDQSLMHRNTAEAAPDDVTEMDTDKAWLLGLFVGDGSCGVYEYDHPENPEWDTLKESWCLNNQQSELLNRAGKIMREKWGVDTRVAEVMESSGTMKLQPSTGEKRGPGGSGSIGELVSEFRDRCYTESGQKKVPAAVMNAQNEAVEEFLNGYMAADGHVGDSYDKQFHEADTKHLPLASGIAYLLQRIGYTFNINYRRNNDTEYYKLRCQKWHRGDPEKLQSIEEYRYDGKYVYDLETENHHFHAGGGNLIVHNSNYVQFPDTWSQEDTLEYATSLCKELEKKVYPKLCDEFNIPRSDNRWEIDVEMRAERFFMSDSKKNYAYLKMWDEGDDFDAKVNDGKGKFSVTGYQCVKSNFSMLTKETQEEVLEQIVRGADKPEIVETVHEAAASIDPTDPDWDYIGIPQGLGKRIDPYNADSDDCYSWSSTGDHPRGEAPRAAWFGNQLLDVEFAKGDKPKRVKLRGNNTVNGDQVDVIGFDDHHDLPEDTFVVDASEMQRKCLRLPLEDILEAIDIEVEAALQGSCQEQSGLTTFM